MRPFGPSKIAHAFIMHVVLHPSPSRLHRYRVTLPGKRQIDFGSSVSEAYVDHRDPIRMRLELHTRGALIPDSVLNEMDVYEIHREMLSVDTSVKYDWDDAWSAHYWDRWLLHSYPTVEQAKLYMTMRKGILFMPVEDNFFYCDHL